jgi:predicted acyl esterase
MIVRMESIQRYLINETMMKEIYIVVYQDVRGRYMSGLYDNMRGFVPNRKIRRY